MPIYKQTTEITKIDDVWANIDRDIIEVYFGDKNIFTVWGEYDSTFPITISANGDALLDYRTYGTDGGVGEPTENLFDPNDPGIERGYYYGYNNGISTAYGNNAWESGWIPVTPGDYTFYLKRTYVGFYLYVNFYNSQKEFVKTIVSVTNPNGFYTRTISDIGYVRFNGVNGYATDWLVARGNVTSYTPHGYKLPMTVGNGDTAQTVPVYIGENQLDSVEGVSDYVDKSSGKIVRMIGEHTFTGDENVSRYGSRVHRILLAPAPLSTANIISTRCSHFTAIRNMSVPNFTNTAEYTCIISSDSARFCVNYLGDLKVYFKEQYDNGTPVKVWYVLETPIEEDPPVPLPQIPTIDGTTIIDYDGDPKPSQMYVKYRKQHS